MRSLLKMRVLRAGAAAMLLGLMLAPAALAQGPLELTTTYPAVIADPGSTVRFPIAVITDVATRVDLTVTSQPTGWTTIFRGGGSTVGAVSTAPNPDVAGQISAAVTAEIAVPADVTEGQNRVVIQGRTVGGATTSLSLDLTIEAQSAGSVKLTTASLNLRGSTSTTFRPNMTITNDTNQQQVFSVDAQGPAGWSVEAKPSGDAQATTMTVDAGGTGTFGVTIDPPADAVADIYEINVTATGGPEPVSTTLMVEITGSYSLSLSTSDQRLNANATAGAPSTLNLLVTNTGSAPLTNVKLTSTPPRGWKITFDKETIAQIAAGSGADATVAVVATIEPPANAVAGDYQLTMRASSADESSANDSIEVRTTVDTSPIGLLIGVAILIVVAVGLFFVFQRYGRR